MKLKAEGYTDSAAMVIYWPELISPEQRLKFRHDPGDLARELRENGCLIDFPCDADGRYLATIFVNEDPPPDLMQFIREQKTVEHVIAKGPALFDGAENLAPEPAEGEAPQESIDPESALAIPDGLYSARVSRLDAPKTYEAEWLQARFGKSTMRQRKLHNSVGSFGSVIVLAAIIAIFVTSWQIWAPLVALAMGVIVVGRTMGRNPAFEQIRAAQAEYRMTCQSYVVELRSAAS